MHRYLTIAVVAGMLAASVACVAPSRKIAAEAAPAAAAGMVDGGFEALASEDVRDDIARLLGDDALATGTRAMTGAIIGGVVDALDDDLGPALGEGLNDERFNEGVAKLSESLAYGITRGTDRALVEINQRQREEGWIGWFGWLSSTIGVAVIFGILILAGVIMGSLALYWNRQAHREARDANALRETALLELVTLLVREGASSDAVKAKLADVTSNPSE